MDIHRHLDDELSSLRDRVLLLGGEAEQALERAMYALSERDSDVARQVLEHDDQIDHLEVEIDRHCTIEPDEENLKASGKCLLDVLQPMHPVRRPYGLGIILEDAPSCLHALRVNHIQSSRRFTSVRIYRSSRKEA